MEGCLEKVIPAKRESKIVTICILLLTTVTTLKKLAQQVILDL